MPLRLQERSPIMLSAAVVAALSMGTGSIAAFLGGVWFGIAFSVLAVVITCAVLSLAMVVLIVDQNGLVVRSSLFGFRVLSVPLTEMVSVSVQDFRALPWGGWGLRRKPGGKALALHGDQAVVIRKNDGRSSWIVIQEADRLSAALQQTMDGPA